MKLSTPTKHRIVGGLVLTALLAILVPVLISHSHVDSASEVHLLAKAPAPPPLPPMQLHASTASVPATSIVAAAEPVAIAVAPLVPEEMGSSTEISPQAIALKPEVVASNVSASIPTSIPKAWVIQVGSFSNGANGEKLLSQLNKKGFEVYKHQVKSNSGQLITQVFIGPDIHKENLEKIQQQLKNELHISGVVKPYSV